MKQSERYIKEVLNKDIQISDTVERRIQDTYGMLKGKRCYRHRSRAAVAAAAVLICLAVPGVVYASSRSDFFKAMFGNETKKSNKAFTQECDDGKGGTYTATVPSKEYVSVDEGEAEQILGKYMTKEPIERKIGDHTLRIENMVYDRNSALLYFTLEKKGGVTALSGDEDTNLSKGAYFTEESEFYFYCESEKGILGYDNIYIDTQKSTSEKIYGYTYIIWEKALADGDTPELVIERYPCKKKNLKEGDDIRTEKVALTDKGQVPVNVIDLGKEGYLEYSPISLCVDMSKGMGLTKEEAADPYYLKSIKIVYTDGSGYVVSDRDDNIENNGYVMGTGTWYKTVFSRLVNTGEIEKIVVNGREFHVAVE